MGLLYYTGHPGSVTTLTKNELQINESDQVRDLEGNGTKSAGFCFLRRIDDASERVESDGERNNDVAGEARGMDHDAGTGEAA